VKPSVVDAVKSASQEAKSSAKTVSDSVKDTAQEVKPSVVDAVKSASQEAKSSAKTVSDSVKDTAQEVKPSVVDTVKSASQDAKSSARSAANSVKDAAQDAKEASDRKANLHEERRIVDNHPIDTTETPLGKPIAPPAPPILASTDKERVVIEPTEPVDAAVPVSRPKVAMNEVEPKSVWKSQVCRSQTLSSLIKQIPNTKSLI
jgi:hypothetical protein